MDIKDAYIGTEVSMPHERIRGKIVDLKMSDSGLNRVYATIETSEGHRHERPLDLLIKEYGTTQDH